MSSVSLNPSAVQVSLSNQGQPAPAPDPQAASKIVEPMIRPPEVVERKPVEIAIDTSGRSSASVRESAQPIEKVVQETAQAIQDFIRSQGGSLSVSVDDVTGYHVIKVMDSSGNLVMHLPSEAAIRVAHNMQSLQGLFVHNIA